MRNPEARRATARPMRPSPMMPSVFPHTSVPHSWSRFHFVQAPDRAMRSPSTRRRATAISSVHAKSAVVSSRTPGVFVTATFRSVHAGTSILSKPTATLATIRRFGPAASSSSRSIFSVSRQISASLPETRCKTSDRGGRSSPVQYSTSKCSASFLRGSSNKTCVENNFGLLTRGLAD